MAIVLKEEAANSVSTPTVGKTTLFVDDNGVMSIKNDAGNVSSFPTLETSNTQVLYTDELAIGGDNNFTWDKNSFVLTVNGNIDVTRVKTDNLLYANGTPYDLQQPGGSNTQIQFNDEDQFGGSSAFTFNNSTNAVAMGGSLSVTGNASAGNISTAGVVTATGNVTANYFIGNGSQLTGIDATAIQNGTANVRTFNNGNVTVSASGNANILVVTGTGTNVAGTLNATGNLAAGGELSVTGNAIISGNLTVDGNLVYVNVESIAVEDPIIQLQTGPNGATPSSNSGKDVGSALNYYDSQARVAFMGWDVSNAEFGLASEASITNEVVTFSTYGNLRAGVYFGNAAGLTDIPGGNIVGNISGNISNAAHAVTANTVVDAAQPNITSVGTLTSLAVTGNASAGNISTGGVLSVTGNANVGNIGGTGAVFTTLGGSLTTASQPNITSIGTLSSLSVTGNVSAGNLSTGGEVNATGNVTAAYFIGNGSQLTGIDATAIQNGTANVRTFLNANVAVSAAGNANIVVVTGTGANVAGTLDVTGNANLVNLGASGLITATGNVSGGNLTTAGALSVTGNANVGNVGGTGAVFTTLGGSLTTASQPNITSVGTLANLSVTGNANVGNIGAVNAVFTGTGSFGGNVAMANFNITNLAGPVNSTDAATKGYVDSLAEGLHIQASCDAATDDTLATISGGTVTYNNGTAGVGANLVTTGSYTTIDGVTLSDGMRILVKDEANAAHNGIYVRSNSTVLTRATDYDTAAEIQGGDFTFITAGTLYNSTGWVQIDPVTTVGTDPIVWEQFSGAGTYQAGTGLTLTGSTFSVNASQTQITAVGTLTGLDVNGNITAANITANTGVFTGNGSGLSAIAGGNVTGQVGNALVAGTVYSAAQANITSVGTLTGLDVNGNITAANITANTGVFTGNGSGLSALVGANVTGEVSYAATANAVAGANVSGTVSSATTAGTVTTAAQPNITSVGTLSSLTVTGNITAGNFVGNFSGNISNANYANFAGTVVNAAQPNITSVGTLSSLTTSGNVVVSGNVVIETGITSNRSNVSVSSSPTVIDQFSPSSWRTAKYVISASGADGYQSVEALLVHDGVNAYITIYGSISSNNSADIIELSANVNGNVAVYAVSNSANCVVNLVPSYIKT